MSLDPPTAFPSVGWPLGFVTVDLDGLWALRQCYGQPREKTFTRDPIWENGVPWLLDTFDNLGIRATFFIVARDLEVDAKRERAEEILRRGHEIANHSLTHRIGLTRLPMGELMEDLRASQQMFEETLGMRPLGFRSPGYDVDARLLRAVRRAGFLYDSSLLPTWWAPLFRLADWWVARRVALGKRQFGRLRYGWAPLRPYRPPRFAMGHRDSDTPGEESSTSALPDFWEIPISVTPGIRFPVGAGYVLMAGKGYLPRAMEKFKSRNLPVVFLVHGADVTDLRRGNDRVFVSRRIQPSAAGFGLAGETKRRRVTRALTALSETLTLCRVAEWVQSRPPANPRSE